MERNVSFQIGGLDEDSLLQSWMKNKQKSTNDSKDELILQEKIRNSSVRRGDAQLHLAVRIGNLVQVKDILTNFQTSAFKGSIWKKNGNGETALLIASENGHVEIVQEILKAAWRQSANPNVDNSLDAFHTAAKLGHAGKFCLISFFSNKYFSEIWLHIMDYLYNGSFGSSAFPL